MKYSKIFNRLVKVSVFILICFAFYQFFFRDYLYLSAISDKPSILIKIWDDNALSIGGITYDDSKETMELRKEDINPHDKWYLKNKRKLTTKELDCLISGFFATGITNGHVDIVCYSNNEDIIYIN
ncbi:hypothetical protein [Moellerella wisconsensis]|uniref:Uncharacterized protein n=2 Tax=Moellerella wisconsensis TaxID=158849 RepID=A0A9Q8Q0Y1_9GAMM|nr:hypothetical protein [Moellerella wisconsensis]UNH23857.1 hypothetical protein MNY68_13770 [Moellerella wisconsensis]UNH30430.1 hypothetical protein MNY72_13990 [Moellerella wisconsensis]UNH38587.1 hypothetical protein MNY70_14115 [Moellerella wisconsensis]UNH42106.1 hypothetical protein MNY66_13845 [Moellerella wisconsensis]